MKPFAKPSAIAKPQPAGPEKAAPVEHIAMSMLREEPAKWVVRKWSIVDGKATVTQEWIADSFGVAEDDFATQSQIHCVGQSLV